MIPQQEEKKTSSENYVGYPLEQLVNCNNIPEGTNTAFFTYGRFQPAHTGHKKMIEQLLEIALVHNARTGTNITPEKTNVYVFVSPSGGAKEKKPHKNPLSPNQKVDLLQKQYAGYPIHFINMGAPLPKGIPTSAFGALALLNNPEKQGIGCYAQTVILIGEDRINFAQQMLKYGLTGFKFAERPEGAMSATQLRNAAINNDINTFSNGIQFGAVTPEHTNQIFQNIRAKSNLQGGKKRKRTRRRWRKPRRKTRKTKKTKKTKRKSRRRCKTKRKSKRKTRKTRKTRKGICRFR
jgi:hypothetical protein